MQILDLDYCCPLDNGTKKIQGGLGPFTLAAKDFFKNINGIKQLNQEWKYYEDETQREYPQDKCFDRHEDEHEDASFNEIETIDFLEKVLIMEWFL